MKSICEKLWEMQQNGKQKATKMMKNTVWKSMRKWEGPAGHGGGLWEGWNANAPGAHGPNIWIDILQGQTTPRYSSLRGDQLY